MIKFVVTGDGKIVIGLGIVAKNVEYLKKGHPIPVKLSEMGFESNMEILLFYGEDETALFKMLEGAGLITDNTKVNGKNPVAGNDEVH